MTISHFTLDILPEIYYNRNMKSLPPKPKASAHQANKYKRILDATYELFLERGDISPSISEITEHAGVAKGTFYLYFQDKDDLKNSLIVQKSHEFFQEAVVALRAAELEDFEEQVIFVINYLINKLADNPLALKLIAKDLSLGVFSQKLQNYVDDEKSDVLQALRFAAHQNGIRLRHPRILLFMIIELTSSTCFSCILESKPLSIDEFKPFLFATIRQMIRDAVVE